MFTYADITPGVRFRDKNDPTELHGMYDKIYCTSSWFNPLYQTKSAHQVLPCKADKESIIHVRPQLDKNGGIQAHSGYARHQKPGLFTDYDKPMNLPIMPVVSHFDIHRFNDLGTVP